MTSIFLRQALECHQSELQGHALIQDGDTWGCSVLPIDPSRTSSAEAAVSDGLSAASKSWDRLLGALHTTGWCSSFILVTRFYTKTSKHAL